MAEVFEVCYRQSESTLSAEYASYNPNDNDNPCKAKYNGYDVSKDVEQYNCAGLAHYYPYGLKIAASSSKKFPHVNDGDVKNNDQYQGGFSEMDEDIGWNDFALRSYDPQIGRWMQQDPYQEFSSPYVGMGNDPANMVDPNGGSILTGVGTAGRLAVGAVGRAIIGMVAEIASGGDSFRGMAMGAILGAIALNVNGTSVAIQTMSVATTAINASNQTQQAGNVRTGLNTSASGPTGGGTSGSGPYSSQRRPQGHGPYSPGNDGDGYGPFQNGDEEKMNNNEGYWFDIPYFWKPWIFESEFTRKSKVQYAIFNKTNATYHSKPFEKDVFGTNELNLAIGLAGAKAIRRVFDFFRGGGWVLSPDSETRISDFAGGVLGLATSAFEVQVSYGGEYVEAEFWYGKYQYNEWTDKLTAVDYYGSDYKTIQISSTRTERIINTANGKVLATRVYHSSLNAGNGLAPLPKTDFGTF